MTSKYNFKQTNITAMHKFISFVFVFVLFVNVTKAQVVGGQGRVESSQPTKKTESTIFKNGFFIDFLFQGGPYSYTATSATSFVTQTVSLSTRMGNKWYFGNMERYRPGLTMTWFRPKVMIGDDGTGDPLIVLGLSAVNVGLTNTISFNEVMGLEVNLNFGGVLYVDVTSDETFPAFLINPNVKFRYKQIAVGLDVSYSVGQLLEYSIPIVGRSVLVGLTIGRKF